jgi:hypothetical protein
MATLNRAGSPLAVPGYEEGRKSTNKMSGPSMKEAVQKSSALTNVEVQRVKQLYNVDISGWNKSNSMKDVKLRLQQILKRDIHTEVKMVQAQSRGSGHAKTSFWKLRRVLPTQTHSKCVQFAVNPLHTTVGVC